MFRVRNSTNNGVNLITRKDKSLLFEISPGGEISYTELVAFWFCRRTNKMALRE